MIDRYGYSKGRCLICGEDKDVRHKNLFLIGSEGTEMCIDCEMDLLKYLRNKKMNFTKKRIAAVKALRKNPITYTSKHEIIPPKK